MIRTQLNRYVKCLAYPMTAGLLCLSLAAAPLPKTTTSGATASKTKTKLANTHLHSAADSPSKDTKADKTDKKEKEKKTKTVHGRRWSYAAWSASHRGTGTVSGQVLNKQGKPVAGARVALRGPKGGVLRSVAARHVIYTGADGRFVMHNVRIGSYRVRATKAKAHGGNPVHVAGGQSARVSLKM